VRHFCPFPLELVEKILLLTTDIGDIVLDPFAGSGMVLTQAFCMKRKFIGFEINPDYVKTFKENVIPSLRIRRRQIQNEMNLLEERRKDFAGKVKILRILKYPKSVFKRLVQKEPGLLDCIRAIIIEELHEFPLPKSNKFVRTKITFVINIKDEIAKIQKHIASVINKPPISKFGIESVIDYKVATDLLNNACKQFSLNGKSLYIYQGGKTHYYDKKTTFKEITNKFVCDDYKMMWKNGYPPIISTLGIRQAIIKTWEPKSQGHNIKCI
jgi:hypothetical protein